MHGNFKNAWYKNALKKMLGIKMIKKLTRNSFENLDQQDELASFRDKFQLPEGIIYLDGNSLGAMPKSAVAKSADVVSREWGEDLITSWNKNGWFHLCRNLGERIAPIVGANPNEVMVCDATGINLYKLLSVALQLRSERKIILMEGSNFPTDNYMAQGLIKQLGQGHEIKFIEQDTLVENITEDIAVVCLTHVHYKTGHMHNMKAITEKAHQVGALIIWDLCHSVGAAPIFLNQCDADFAVGCTYKYLNGGPGSPAFLYMAKRHHGKAMQPLSGWWSHADPFAFEQNYRPADTIWQMMTGTQPILSLATLECGLEIMEQADINVMREKSLRLGDAFIQLMEQKCAGFDITLASPRTSAHRGSHISFYHKNGYAIIQALIAEGVVGDFRAPDIMRFGLTPLYLKYTDIWDAVEKLNLIMTEKLWQRDEYQNKDAVT